MDQCRLTPEQVQTLTSGKKILVKYSTIEEFGRTALHELELVPCSACGSSLEGDVSDENNSAGS